MSYPPSQYPGQGAPFPSAGGQLPGYGHPHADAGGPMYYPQARKSPELAVLLSLLIPGLGTMVSGAVPRGVLILLASILAGPLLLLVGFLLSIFGTGIAPVHVLLLTIPVVLGVWIWGMVDAYRTASTFNRTHHVV